MSNTAPTPKEIKDRLEEENFNLGAANRKADSIGIFNGFLLLALLDQAVKANDTLEKILAEVD